MRLLLNSKGGDSFLREIIMNIQPFGLQNIPQWQRQDLAAAPLGAIGNLRVHAARGGTARASRPGLMELVRDAWANLKFRRRATPGEQQQRAARSEVYGNSWRIGNFLGSLTGSWRKGKDLLRIERGLEQLSMKVTHDLADLSGGEYILSTYMSELTRADLEAMYDGILSHPNTCAALLNKVPPALQGRADNVLQQIKAALTHRLIQVLIVEPLWRIHNLMLAQFVSEQQLAAQLLTLSTGLVGSDLNQSDNGPATYALLDNYFRTLSEDRLRELSLVFQPQILEPARSALGRLGNQFDRQQALSTLDSIHHALGREINSLFTRDLKQVNSALILAELAGDQLAASKALYDLHLMVDKIKQLYGWLPDQVVIDVRIAVDKSLFLFRNTQHNPSGSLNVASLERLEDAVLLYLRGASRLRALGLDLGVNALNEVGLSRVYKYCSQFSEESSKGLPKQELNLLRREKLSEAERALKLIDFGEKRREAEAMIQVMRSWGGK